MEWTTDQKKAIELRGSDILVTAAAGSGKTAVLVERILSLLWEGADISRMLIVTFTRAAASSMREKLANRLYEIAAENEALLKQAERVEGASICTIDSFCAEFLRVHFASAGVDPSFRIIEETERSRLRDQAVREALSQAYAENSPAFSRLSRYREPDALIRDVTELMTFREAQPDPDAWRIAPPMDECVAQLELAALDLIGEAADAAGAALDVCAGEAAAYEGAIQSDLDAFSRLLSLSGQALREALGSFAFERVPAVRRGHSDDPEVVAVKDARDAYKKTLAKARDMLSFDDDLARQDHEENALQLSAMLAVARQAEALLAQALDEDNALGFPDMAHRTLRALGDPEIARAARDTFRDAVFVDEYQDVSALQDALIQRVATPGRLFLVGDVKQSIYRFRQAEPGLFLARHARYGRHEGGERIALSANFRSRAAILDYTNLVFSRAMNRRRSEIVYDEEAALKAGRLSEGQDAPVEVYLLPSLAPEDAEEDDFAALEEIEREAALAADQIQRMMAENPDLRFRDFAILSRVAGGVFPRVSDALALRGIPSECETAASFYDAMEIRSALALLRLVENRRRDTDWIAALRFGEASVSLNELAEIRLYAPDVNFADAAMARAGENDDLGRRLRRLMERLDGWRQLSHALPAQQLIYTVIRQSGLLAQAAALPGGAGRVNRLTALCDAAASFDALRHTGLSGFLSDLEDALRRETQKTRSAPESDDAVRLMSVHASKGLEFPVVIGIRLGRGLSQVREDCELSLHSRLGAGMRCVDPDLGASRDTVARRAVRSALADEAMEEELRLLYVLLTRARDRAVLIGSVKDMEKALARYEALARYSPRPATLLDALVPPILLHHPPFARLIVNPVLGGEAVSALPAEEIQAQEDEGFRAAYGWVYPHADASLSPVKMTVTALKREMSGPAEAPGVEERPAFMTQAAPTGAEMGTSVHQLLRALRLDPLRGMSGIALRQEIRAQMEDFVGRGLLSLPPDPNLAARFLESPLGQRMLASDQVRREWAFNLVTTPRQVGHSDSDERMLMQGAIDLCFLENGAWILVDYKTDWEESVLIQRYAPQLRLYARALYQITGKPVREIWLCALKSGRQILLP